MPKVARSAAARRGTLSHLLRAVLARRTLCMPHHRSLPEPPGNRSAPLPSPSCLHPQRVRRAEPAPRRRGGQAAGEGAGQGAAAHAAQRACRAAERPRHRRLRRLAPVRALSWCFERWCCCLWFRAANAAHGRRIPGSLPPASSHLLLAARLPPLPPRRGEDARKAVRAVLPPLLKDGSQLLGHSLLSWSRRALLLLGCASSAARSQRACNCRLTPAYACKRQFVFDVRFQQHSVPSHSQAGQRAGQGTAAPAV